MIEADIIRNRIIGEANTVADLVELLMRFPGDMPLHMWADDEDDPIVTVSEYRNDSGRLMGCSLEFNV